MHESLRLMNLVWDCMEMDITGTEVSVLLNICRSATEYQVPISSARNRIAEQVKVAPSTVDRALNQLIKKRYLKRVEEHSATTAAKYLLNEKRLLGEE